LTLPIVLRRAAEIDLAAIEDWYDGQRHGLGKGPKNTKEKGDR